MLEQVETIQMYSIKTGQRPVAIVGICLVSTANICPVSAADIGPVSTADISPVARTDLCLVSPEFQRGQQWYQGRMLIRALPYLRLG